jgi:hypothetical protein
MADKEAFLKEMRAKLKEWSKIIDELRAEGEEKDITRSKDFNSFSKKGIMIYDNYLEARSKLEELTKTDDATWERQALDIENIIKRLDHLWETF